MAIPRNYNENYTHSCNAKLFKIDQHIAPITESCLSADELKQVLDCFLFSPPVLKDGKTASQAKRFNSRFLGELGWAGNAGLTKLERELLKAANMSNFCFLKSRSMAETSQAMRLDKETCICHSRAIMLLETSLEMSEDGSVKCTPKETRMVCLFRHLRNAIAHNRTYIFSDEEENDTILFEDANDQGVITARILLKAKSLVVWAGIINQNGSGNGDNGVAEKIAVGATS